jgi:hypothetical protein
VDAYFCVSVFKQNADKDVQNERWDVNFHAILSLRVFMCMRGLLDMVTFWIAQAGVACGSFHTRMGILLGIA